MSKRMTGTVKWFDNRKGYGFITPTSEDAPTQEEIFVHQTNIESDGAYRTLADDIEVEFDIEQEDGSGKYKAVRVSAPGGGAIKPPNRNRPRGPRNEDGNKNERDSAGVGNRGRKPSSSNGGSKRFSEPKKEREPFFHESLDDDVKEKMNTKGFDLGKKSTVDVAYKNARVKLGQGGYAGLAQSDGTVGEGSYTCETSGTVNFEWKRAVAFSNGEWKSTGTEDLLKSFSLADDDSKPVQSDETPESLWGADKTDPAEAFEKNGFLMRRVVLTRPPRARGGRPSSQE